MQRRDSAPSFTWGMHLGQPSGPLPTLSIITPCLNRARFIRAAVESVRDQGYPHVQHVVADGGSTDGTLEILAEYPEVTVISEPDTGLYDALNKALRRTTGEVIGHLNSDDMYAPGALHTVGEAFARDPELDTVAGGSEVFEDNGDGAFPVVLHNPGHSHGSLTLDLITVGVPIINARFFHRRVYDAVGEYRQRYPIAADREFLLRVWMYGPKAHVADALIHRYRRHDGSLTMRRDNPVALQSYVDTLDICAAFNVPSSPRAVRVACARWHSIDTANAAIESLRMGQPRKALHFAWLGLRHNPLWPVRIGVEISHRLMRRATGRRRR